MRGRTWRVEEIKQESEEQESYVSEVRILCSLLSNDAGSLGGKY
jgi:hypothetical protein